MKSPILAALVTTAALASASDQDHADDVEQIRSARMASNEAIAKHDIETMRSFLASARRAVE